MKKEVTKELTELRQANFEFKAKRQLLGTIRVASIRTFLTVMKYADTLPDYPGQLLTTSSCYLYGKEGFGKSVNAAWFMLEWARLNYINGNVKVKGLYTTCGNILQELRDSYSRDSEIKEKDVLDKYKLVDILVIDDIGAFSNTDWAYQQLYLIIDYRYSHMKTTIYTSNLSLTQLATALNDFRIPSRIEHDCGPNIIQMDKENKRKIRPL